MNSSDNLKHGKLIGAIMFFILNMAPLLLGNYIAERTELMKAQSPIKAILKQDIEYKDLTGQTQVIKKDEIVDLYIIKSGSTVTDASGNTTVQNKQSYVAISGMDSFDVVPGEFKTID